MKTIGYAVLGLAVAAVAAGGAELSLKPTKDARILGHSSERDQNGGASTRLRTTGIGRTSAEFVAIEFDRAAIGAFLEKNKEKALSGKLTLTVREVQGVADAPVKLEVASIDTAADWNEGKGSQTPAKKGECCANAAAFGEKKWSLPDGAEVATFRDLVWDGAAVKGRVNGKGVEIAKDAADKVVSIELEADFVRHLGTPASKGIFLFHRDAAAKIDVYSREQVQKGAVLVLKAE